MTTKIKRTFRLGTTSFIYPDYCLPNVLKLGSLFDEIELLAFESPEASLPDLEEIRGLKAARDQLNVTYNIHLPTDISLTHENSEERKKAAQRYAEIIDRFACLAPTTHTLHLERPEPATKTDLEVWQQNTKDGLERLISCGVDPSIITIETLNYDISCITPVIQHMGFHVCLDMGHAFKYGYDPQNIMDTHKEKLDLIHLHGVEFSDKLPPKDHTGLDKMSLHHLEKVITFLSSYTGTVSVEVFRLEHLKASLKVLDQYFEQIPRL